MGGTALLDSEWVENRIAEARAARDLPYRQSLDEYATVLRPALDAPTINGRLHGLSDAELIASGIPYTIVKPHFFMQNLLMAAESIAQQGAMYLPLADSRIRSCFLRSTVMFEFAWRRTTYSTKVAMEPHLTQARRVC